MIFLYILNIFAWRYKVKKSQNVKLNRRHNARPFNYNGVYNGSSPRLQKSLSFNTKDYNSDDTQEQSQTVSITIPTEFLYKIKTTTGKYIGLDRRSKRLILISGHHKENAPALISLHPRRDKASFTIFIKNYDQLMKEENRNKRNQGFKPIKKIRSHARIKNNSRNNYRSNMHFNDSYNNNNEETDNSGYSDEIIRHAKSFNTDYTIELNGDYLKAVPFHLLTPSNKFEFDLSEIEKKNFVLKNINRCITSRNTFLITDNCNNGSSLKFEIEQYNG
ncbi:hypothetical protein NUSPORA_00973 [Nucleospora cyclopteri]